MMRQWFNPAEICAAARGDLPSSVRGLNLLIERNGWRLDGQRCRQTGGKGGGFEYHISLLPKAVQLRLSAAHGAPSASAAPLSGGETKRDAWARFDRLPQKHKDEALARLAALELAAAKRLSGLSGTAAVRAAARECGVSAATLYNWQALVAGLARADWLAALAPGYKGPSARAVCEDAAFDMLKSDFLRDSKASFSACYERVAAVAKKSGWPLPSARTMRRMLERNVPKAVQVRAREGADEAKRLYPAQVRSVAHMHAMHSVNMDGHKLDVFIRTLDGRITRYFLIGIQDLYSRKVLAWRLAESENKETVRLVIGDMAEAFGIPGHIYLDNGRAFASKWISGGAKTRFRFKVRDEDPQGLLLALGIAPGQIHWTTPYAGQSKPIERAWRDLAEQISKHPFCDGAYTGNAPDAKPDSYNSRAIPLDDMRAHVAREVAAHNARSGRRTETAKKRSFDATFAESLAAPGVIVADAPEAMKALWLLAAEKIRARKGNGEIHFMGNRYWSEALTGHANRDVTVRFDPDFLQEPLRVYDSENRLICMADCIDRAGFDDQGAARSHAKSRRDYLNLLKAQKALHVTMSAAELARVYADGAAQPAPQKQKSKVTRLPTAALPADGNSAGAPVWDEDDRKAFSRSLRMIAGGKG